MADVVHRADRLDTFDASFNADRSDFSQTGPSVTPSGSLKGAGTWTRRLTPLDRRPPAKVHPVYRLESNPQTEQLVYNIVFGGKARLRRCCPSMRHRTGRCPAIGYAQSTAAVDVSGNLTLTYQPFGDVNFAFLFSQDVSPGQSWRLDGVQSVAASVNYLVNDYAKSRSRCDFNNSTSTSKAATSSRYLTVSPSLNLPAGQKLECGVELPLGPIVSRRRYRPVEQRLSHRQLQRRARSLRRHEKSALSNWTCARGMSRAMLKMGGRRCSP